MMREARISICSAWSNSAVHKISSAPASATWRSWLAHSAGVPRTVAASRPGIGCP